MIKDPSSSITTMEEMPKLTEKDIVEYIKERFEDLKAEPAMDDLISFHSNNKYLLMVHSPSKLKKLGNIVANHEKRPLKITLQNYQESLFEALETTPTIKTHINALMHIFGFFGKYLNNDEKSLFLQFVKDYRKNKIALGKILSEIEPITYKINNLYLISQTYFLLYSDAKIGNVFEKYDPNSFLD